MGLSLWIVPDPETASKLQRVMKIRPPDYDPTQATTTAPARKNKSYPTFYPHITLASLPLSMEADLDGAVRDALLLPGTRTSPSPSSSLAASGTLPDPNTDPDSDPDSDPDPGTTAAERERPAVCCAFASLETGDVYHRSVYVAFSLSARRSPGLAALHAQVHARLGVPVRTPAFPHMSLAYIDGGDADGEGGENGQKSREERRKYYDALVAGKVWRVVDGQSDLDIDTDRRYGLDTGVASSDDGGGVTSDFLDHFVAHEVWAVRCVGPVEDWVVLRRWPIAG